MSGHWYRHVFEYFKGLEAYTYKALLCRYFKDKSARLLTLRRLKHHSPRRIAFTLAEVLITLGIIGVVAAMTLPALIQNYQDKELISRTKKVFAEINNVISLAQKDLGVIGDNSFLFNETDSDYVVAKNLAKYFNGAIVCENSAQNGCSKYYYDIKYSSIVLDENNSATTTSGQGAKIILPSGAILRIESIKTGCAPIEITTPATNEYGQPIKNPDGSTVMKTFTRTNCAFIYFDVNGTKRPNQFGRDNFVATVYRNKVTANYGGKASGSQSFLNILTGKDKLEYTDYSKGQGVE